MSNTMRLRVGLTALALLAFLVMWYLAGHVRLGGGPAAGLEDFGAAPEFALIDQAGHPVASGGLRGKVVVSNFIYTSCRDICPLLSLKMRDLQDELAREGLLGESVQLLSFSVDPARDTPEVLRAYAERHQADPSAWRFLTGPEDQVIPLVVDGFRLGVQALPPAGGEHADGTGAGDYEVMHSGRFVLIDRAWRIRAYYDWSELDLDRVVRDVRRLAT